MVKFKLKMENKTKFNNKELRKLFLAVMKKESVNSVAVIVGYSKHGMVFGEGGLGYPKVWIWLPNTKRICGSDGFPVYDSGRYKTEQLVELNPHQVKVLAQVFIHELAHNRGLNHKEMVHWSALNVDYVTGFKVTRNPDSVKQSKNIKQVRHTNAIKMLRIHQSKLKREQNLVKKWSRKVQYYNHKNEKGDTT